MVDKMLHTEQKIGQHEPHWKDRVALKWYVMY